MVNIALVGNPNCGKTTMFNDLTGSSQYVGNWPGVTVEKKEGKLIKDKTIKVIDLPGIYSFSPYSLEEVITRDYIMDEKPDCIINIVDGTNLERNLYLTSQVVEMGIPTIIALNMSDILKSEGTTISKAYLEKMFSCPVVETSATKGTGLTDLIEKAVQMAKNKAPLPSYHSFSDDVEEYISKIKTVLNKDIDRYHLIKLFERDHKATKNLNLSDDKENEIEKIIEEAEGRFDDDAESIITNERYEFITHNLKGAINRKKEKKETKSDKIDKIVTNRWLAIPIFLAIMWLVYYISISTVGDMCIGYVENLFGFLGDKLTGALEALNASEPVVSLLNDGILQSIGAIFTFVPQLMILFFFLSLLEDSGYMARVAFIMDKIFRNFGLSGKSFIPMLIGTGCSIPGVMATRTIENEADRKMTILLTPFIPCGAKLPVFAMFITLIFGGAAWIGPFIYLFSIVAVIIAGIILKKTKKFQGDPAPFVMELPQYRLPSFKGVLIHMWDRAKSFIKKAGTIIFIACAVLWVLQHFTFTFEYLPEDVENSMLAKIGGFIRYIFIPLGFGDSWAPAVATFTGLIAKEVVVATFASIGQHSPIYFSHVTAFAFIIFTMFAAPCFAAIGAMRREFGNRKDTWFAILFQTGTAYVLATIVNIFGNIIFKGTSLVEKKQLAYDLAEEASENDVIHGNLLLYVFVAVIVISLLIGLVSRIRQKAKYKK